MALIDDFNRADAASLGIAANGNSWVGYQAANFGIVSNRAQADTPNSFAYPCVDAGGGYTHGGQDATISARLAFSGLVQAAVVLNGNTTGTTLIRFDFVNTGTARYVRILTYINNAIAADTGSLAREWSDTGLVEVGVVQQGGSGGVELYLVVDGVQLASLPLTASQWDAFRAQPYVGLFYVADATYTGTVAFDDLSWAAGFTPPAQIVYTINPMHAVLESSATYAAYRTDPDISDQPYIEYPVHSTTTDFKTPDPDHDIPGPTSSGDVVHWNTYYSRFQRIAPMATYYEGPAYVPPDAPPEAEKREESFRNRAGIRIEVWDLDDPNGNLLAVMSRSRNRRWFEALNEPGGGSFEIHLDDPVLYDHPDIEAQGLLPRETILKYGNIVRCYLDGIARFSFKLENLRVTRVGSGEKSDQWVEVSGRGVLACLEDAVVYPEYGFTPKSRGEKRLFTFVANAYEGVIDDGTGLGYTNFGWGWAAELKAQFDQATPPWIGSPKDWPELGQNALWIWDKVRGSRTAPAPSGFVYFLKRFYIDNEEDIAFFAAADDAFELYLDGQPLMQNGGTFGWRETMRADLKVAAGHHLIAVRCENIARPYGDAPGGFIFTMASLGEITNTTVNEKATFAHYASGGQFTMSFNGSTTASLPYNADRFAITAALEALPTIEPGDVYVTQSRVLQRGGYWRYVASVEFAGPTVRWKDQPDMAWNASALTGAPGGTEFEPLLTIRQGGVFENIEPAELLLVSDKTWRCLAYPETLEAARNSPPAFPPGAVMRFLLEEARARGVQYANSIKRLHSDYRDNDDKPFDIVVDTAFDIGMDLLQVAERLAETSVDIYMSPWLELSMWVERGIHRDQAHGDSYVELREGKNLSRATYDDRGIIRNALLLRTAEGWREELHNFDPETQATPPDSSSLSVWGRREAFLSLGNAPSDEQVERTVSYAFSLAAQPNSSTVFEVPDTQKAQNESRPYVHFNVGDWIVVPDMHGIRRSRRVVGLGVSENEDGEVYFAVEMTNPRDEYERRLERWLETIQIGTLRGSIASAAPVEPTAVRGGIV